MGLIGLSFDGEQSDVYLNRNITDLSKLSAQELLDFYGVVVDYTDESEEIINEDT
jgi:hypothetical protein